MDSVPDTFSASATQTVDGSMLRSWFDTVRHLSSQSGHLEICDTLPGELRAHSSKELDSTWSCFAVRDLIEATESPNFSEGFIIGTLNQRGVVMRMSSDGGDLERNEGAKFASYAKTSETDWPITASILRKIAEIYERLCRDDDAAAEIRRLKP